MVYATYGKYRESGIGWLKRVPSHWDVTKFKRYCDIQLGKMLQPQPSSPTDIQIPYLRAMHVQWEKVDTCDLPEMWASEKEVEKFGVKSGDLLVCEGGEVGRTAILNAIDGRCIIQNALHRIRGNEKTFPPYINYLMRHIADARWFEILCNKATIAHLTGEKLGELGLPLPTPDEQQAIARFLDFKTAQIDALIAKKKALLDKLAEKRTALISHAVTKGLDPSVAMKDSGVVWLGNVPAHWKVIPIKFSLDMPITDGPHSTPQFYDEGIPFISAEAVKNDRLDFSRKRGYISEDDHALFSKKYKPKYGDVYMVKSGATTGAVARVETHEEFNIWSPLAVLRPHAEKSITDYLFYVLKSKPFFYSVELSWSYGTQQNIGMGVISNIRMALPPIEEQKAICRYLEPLLQKIEDQRAKVDSVVERLQEYRSALITNAVTGKIDVRGFAIPQPAEGIAL